MDIDQLTTFFGWCTVINFAILSFITLYIMVVRRWAEKIHSRLFGVAQEDLAKIYFEYIAYSQVIMLPTSLVPWLALRLM